MKSRQGRYKQAPPTPLRFVAHFVGAVEMRCLAALVPADFSVGILSMWNIKAWALGQPYVLHGPIFQPGGRLKENAI